MWNAMSQSGVGVASWVFLACLCGAAQESPPPHRAVRIVQTADGYQFESAGQSLLSYQRAPKSWQGRYRRGHYVHPLYDLDGRVLTEDFPDDHRHHRGIFWAWHQVLYKGRPAGDPWLCQEFEWDVVRARPEASDDGSAALDLTVIWRSASVPGGDQKPLDLVRETSRIRVAPPTADRRVFDFAIELEPLVPGLTIGGSDDDKGYGGFSWRVRLPDDLQFRGRLGEIEPQRTAVDAGPWLQMWGSFRGGQQRGILVFCHPRSSGFPQRWILRRQDSMQNAVFPGRRPVPLSEEEPIRLQYRLVLHRHPWSPEQIEQEFIAYCREGERQ